MSSPPPYDDYTGRFYGLIWGEGDEILRMKVDDHFSNEVSVDIPSKTFEQGEREYGYIVNDLMLRMRKVAEKEDDIIIDYYAKMALEYLMNRSASTDEKWIFAVSRMSDIHEEGLSFIVVFCTVSTFREWYNCDEETPIVEGVMCTMNSCGGDNRYTYPEEDSASSASLAFCEGCDRYKPLCNKLDCNEFESVNGWLYYSPVNASFRGLNIYSFDRLTMRSGAVEGEVEKAEGLYGLDEAVNIVPW